MILSSPSKKNIEVWLDQEMVAKGGGTFTPSEDCWRPDPTALSSNIVEAKYAVSEEVQPWLVASLAYYAKEKSARSLKQITYTLKRCASANLDVMDEGNALAIRNLLCKSEFSCLRAFLKQWKESYLLAICPSESTIKALYEMKAQSDKGPCPVESMNPQKGPFTALETQALFNWANDAYADGRVSIERFVYIRLLIATGARIRQLQQLVFGDLVDSGMGATLRMPKAKDKTFEYRSSFQLINLTPDLANTLIVYRRLILNRLQVERPGVDWAKAISNAPVFFAKRSKFAHDVIVDDPDLELLETGPQEKFHKPDSSMKALLWGLERDQAFPVSERTGEQIHLSSHRFRYTLGTDMSRMGFGPHAIAAALGHKSIRSVGRYIKASPEMGRRIDNKMKEEMALVVNAFQGRLVTGADAAINGSSPNKTIRSQSGAIATCGASGGCHLDAPVACYTCSKFQPWIEGPHEEVLERLQMRKNRVVDEAGESSNAAISFDRPILSVIQVIDRIKKIKNEAKGDINE